MSGRRSSDWQLVVIGLLTQFMCCDIAAARCLINVQDMIFGSYDASALLPKTSSAQITIDCRSPIIVTVNIGASVTSGSIANRQMRHSYKPDRLNYNLYSDPAMTVVWGDGTQAGGQVNRVDGVFRITVYGQIFPGQNVWYGEYSDSVMVTVLP